MQQLHIGPDTSNGSSRLSIGFDKWLSFSFPRSNPLGFFYVPEIDEIDRVRFDRRKLMITKKTNHLFPVLMCVSKMTVHALLLRRQQKKHQFRKKLRALKSMLSILHTRWHCSFFCFVSGLADDCSNATPLDVFDWSNGRPQSSAGEGNRQIRQVL